MGKRHGRVTGSSEAARRAALAMAEKKAEGVEVQRRLDKRKALSGDERIGGGFPLDVLLSRRLVSQDMRDEGLRFAQLGWWLFGVPEASVEGLYDRMLTGGVDEDLAPLGSDETDEDVLRRIHSNKHRFERMTRALGGATRGEVAPSPAICGRVHLYRLPCFLPRQGTMFQAVRQVCQFAEMPHFVLAVWSGGDAGDPGPEDFRYMALLTEGLLRLVKLRAAEDRHWRRKHPSRPNGSGP
jgi:hypothetical protein